MATDPLHPTTADQYRPAIPGAARRAAPLPLRPLVPPGIRTPGSIQPGPGAAPVAPAPAAAPLPITPAPEVLTAAPPVPPAPVTPPAPVAPLPVPTTTNNGTVSLSPTNPETALTTQTIGVGPTADRFKIAEDRYNAGQPAYEAALRTAQQHAFGAGRGVSGALRTSLGDAASAREGQRVGFLSDALQGSIDDAYKNVGIAQQQQGFQKGQQDTAFGQDIATKQLNESLTSGAFQRALQQLTAGNANSPDQVALILSQIFGNQASGAGNAASSLFHQEGTNAGTTGTPDWLSQIMKKIQLPNGGSVPQTPGQLPADAGGY